MTSPTVAGIDLMELAAKVEAAACGDRVLDCEIAVALREAPYTAPWATKFPDWRVQSLQGYTRAEVWDGDRLVGHWHSFAPYSASLDAAMTLIPDGLGVGWRMTDGAGGPTAEIWCVAIEGPDAPREVYHVGANPTATPALALTAAALRARAFLIEEERS